MVWSDSESRRNFTQQYWHKDYLHLAADDVFKPPLDVNEIAGLATLDDVESRLILTHTVNGAKRYELFSGQLTDDKLTSLGERDWTVLVHDVDKHFPELRSVFESFNIAPDWLLDDLMISIAAPGGSVGPHTDSYSVFLLQGEGIRHWSLGRHGKPRPDSPLRLVDNVDFDTHVDCHSGDVLYVPPGVIHHGVAKTLSSTWSIGFQAPLLSDIAALAGAESSDAQNDERYRPIITGEHYNAGEIRSTAVAGLPISAPTDALLEALGCLVTQCKPMLRPDPPVVSRPASQADRYVVHGFSRLAYAELDDTLIVFANGQCGRFNIRYKSTVAKLCTTREWLPSETADELLLWLFGIGVFAD